MFRTGPAINVASSTGHGPERAGTQDLAESRLRLTVSSSEYSGKGV